MEVRLYVEMLHSCKIVQKCRANTSSKKIKFTLICFHLLISSSKKQNVFCLVQSNLR